MAERKAKSPWQRHRKTKHRYSPEYQRWFKAARDNDQADMAEANRQWDRRYGRYAVSAVSEEADVAPVAVAAETIRPFSRNYAGGQRRAA